ncbi:MAG: AbrB/MazE/SpoVT family DNA-binding domain-containing protein [Leptolyngbyaceae cyanobacterium]
MEVTRLSSKSQNIIPMVLRQAHQWEPGQEFIAIDTGDGVLLKPKKPFVETRLSDVAGCLRYDGPPQHIEDFDAAIDQALRQQWQ